MLRWPSRVPSSLYVTKGPEHFAFSPLTLKVRDVINVRAVILMDS